MNWTNRGPNKVFDIFDGVWLLNHWEDASEVIQTQVGKTSQSETERRGMSSEVKSQHIKLNISCYAYRDAKIHIRRSKNCDVSRKSLDPCCKQSVVGAIKTNSNKSQT